MKFQYLPLGARFEYDGKVYVKAGPLTATAEDGSCQRMIPRHVLLKPVDAAEPKGDDGKPATVQSARLAAAAALFVTECTRLIEVACARTDPDLAAELMSGLELARRQFEAALGED